MMAESAPGSLERTEWSEFVKLGDQVSRQATVGKSKIDRFHVLVRELSCSEHAYVTELMGNFSGCT